MPPVKLGAIILIGFAIPLSLRSLLIKKFVHPAFGFEQPMRSFYLDFSICFAAGLLINGHNWIAYNLDLYFLFPPMLGCIIAGMFIGVDSALAQERKNLVRAVQFESISSLPKKFFPMTRKFTLIAVMAVIFTSLVLVLVFSRDIQWLADNIQNATAIRDAQRVVYIEIFFIMLVLIILMINLIFAYSKNLRLLFENQTRVLEKVSSGDLTEKVPVATQDEFGFIAGHTNRMIDGLRHRFELINSLKLAEEVQQNLLPDKSPYIKGFDICGVSRYCEETGGDYYDYMLLPNGNTGVVVADAVGHGIGAAMLMTSLRAFLTSAIPRYRNPAQLTGEVNGFLAQDCIKSGRFSAMFFMELCGESKKMIWVRAGHEPPLLYHRKSETFSLLDEGDLVLGVDPLHQFKEHTTDRLDEGDIILIGTDGLNEARNLEGELFGRARIQQCIQENANLPVQQIQTALLEAIRDFSQGANQEDDITIVLVKSVDDTAS